MNSQVPKFKKRFNPRVHRIGLIVDCETTGLSSTKHTAVEIAMIQFVFSQSPNVGTSILGVTETYQGFRDPGSALINPIAMRINRLNLSQLKGQSWDLQRVLKLTQGIEFIVAHNASFDRAFLAPLIPDLDQSRWLCSCHHLDWGSLGHKSKRLKDLCQWYGIPLPDHSAMGDAIALLHLLGVSSPTGESVLTLLLRPR